MSNKVLSIDDIQTRVETIRDSADDPTVAHGMEDQLYLDFIHHVFRYGPPSLREMAHEVLKTQEIDFARWFA